MRHHRLEHRFVRHVPEMLEPGVIYISMEYATAAHSCCCGCGQEVVTPFTPTDWRMTFDGETISLRPSIGSWNLPCRSHYVIERSRIVEAGPWSDEQVGAERARDKAAKAKFYSSRIPVASEAPPAPALPQAKPKGLWGSIRRWFSAP
jgi:hypothetical protein